MRRQGNGKSERGSRRRALALFLAAALPVTLLSIPAWGAPTPIGGSAGWASVTPEKARGEAAVLMGEIDAITSRNPKDPSAIPAWRDASTGDPLPVSLIDGTPSEYIVPVIGARGKVVSTIGVNSKTGRWQWYSASYKLDGFPPVGADEALSAGETALDRRGVDSGRVTPVRIDARLAPDRNIYWHIALAGSTVKELYVPAFHKDRAYTGAEVPWKNGQPDDPGPADLSPVISSAPEDVAAAAQATAQPTEGDVATAHEIPNVPYHQQQTSYFCGPACLEMVFDYWGPDVSQTEIASVANASPSYGVYANELARAAHFSQQSTSVQDPGMRGYQERDLGYGMAEASWGDSTRLYSRRYHDLKNLVANDCPVIILTDYDQGLNSGHFRVVKGYDDRVNTFTVDDPWYNPQPYAGPDVKFRQDYLVDTLWQYSERWGMAAAPWSVVVSKPQAAAEGQTFNVSAQVVYQGISPLDDDFAVQNPTATLQVPASDYRITSGPANAPIVGISTTGSIGKVTWTVQALNSGSTDDVKVVARGLVEGSTSDYRLYTDWIGGVGSGGGTPEYLPTSRTWGHDSVGVSAGSLTWYLAEGCTNGGFETWVLVQNPNPTPANVSLTYMTPAGPVTGPSANLPPNSRKSFNVGDTVSGQWEVSTKVSANKPVIAERAVYGPGRAWGTDSIGVTTPAQDWYLAEGCTNGGFETWVLVQNPNDEPATVSLTYMTPEGQKQGPSVIVAPNSRKTFNVADIVPNNWDVSTFVSAKEPVVAERAVYWNGRKGAHDSIGVAAPANTWYLAEGCTNGGFETWVLVQNAGDITASVDLTFMTETGEKPGPHLDVAPYTRQTVDLSKTIPNAWSVSTKVTSKQPVIAERAVYWNNRIEGHDSIGATTPAKTWYFAEGCTGAGFETWVLVQNPNSLPAKVRLTYMTPTGPVTGPKETIAANSRKTFNMAETVPGVYEVSTKVTSNVPVITERAMYGDPQ
jgi:hypothetical protein